MSFSISHLIITYFFLILIPYAASISFDLTNIGPENQNRDIVTEGDGAYISESGIQLTPNGIGSNQSFKAGRARYIRPFHLWDNRSNELASFSTNFTFVIDSNRARNYADDLTFFLAQNNSVISPGGAMGLPVNPTTIVAINPFVAVEFDTYPNGWDPIDSNNASIGDHVGISISSLTSVTHQKWFSNITGGRVCQAWITYDSVSKNLSVSFTGFQNNTIVRQVGLVYMVDLRTVLPESVIFGFSAANGASFMKHNVRSWSFSSSDLQVDGNIAMPPKPSPNPTLILILNPCPDPVDGDNRKVGPVVGLRRRKKKILKDEDEEIGFDINMNSEFEVRVEPRVSSKEIARSTSEFSENDKLGEGGFGGVYRGFLKDPNTYMVVNRMEKSSKVVGNLVTSPSPSPSPIWNIGQDPVDDNNSKVGLVVGLLVAVAFLAVFVFVLWSRKKKKKALKDEDKEIGFDIDMNNEFEMSTGPKRFSYQELARSTNEFSENEKLGEGGFGGVYRGFIKDSNTYIAVKRVSKSSKQGIKEYASEVKIISRLRHRNLVQLIGWCHEKGELLLVYEFMENGSLDSHLFKAKSLLTWGKRYKIVHGLACALLYLHEDWEQCVLHRDIKSSNVMLDSNFNTKLGDFGLAKLVDHEKGSHTTMLAGTLGYMAPECVVTGKATKESDVFSFGVVALEIASGRKPIEYKTPENQIRLVQWVWELYGSGELLEGVDPRIGLDFEEEEIKQLMILGLCCVHPDPDFRPSMRQAVQVLNFEASLPILPSKMPVASYFTPPLSSLYGVTSIVQSQTSSSVIN